MWVKVDDAANRHPKLLEAGLEAVGLWLAGLCHCNASASDGRIPKHHLPALWPLEDRRKLAKLASKLVGVGLWEDRGDAYVVHDYDHYQSEATREAQHARREYEREKKRKQREKQRLSPGDTPGDTPRDTLGDRPGDRPRDTVRDNRGDSARDTSRQNLARSAVTKLALSPPPDRQTDRPTDRSSLRSDASEVDMGETSDLRMEDVHRIFGEARIAAGGGGVGKDIPRSLYDSLLASLSVFRAEARRRSVDAKALVSEAARAFCADSWAASAGWPEKAWLNDPGKWLVSRRALRPQDPSPAEDFKQMTEEEFERLFAPREVKHA